MVQASSQVPASSVLQDFQCFVPAQRIAILIGNKDYSARRQENGYGGFTDLEAVDQDIENMENGLKSLGFRQDEIDKVREAGF